MSFQTKKNSEQEKRVTSFVAVFPTFSPSTSGAFGGFKEASFWGGGGGIFFFCKDLRNLTNQQPLSTENTLNK